MRKICIVVLVLMLTGCIGDWETISERDLGPVLSVEFVPGIGWNKSNTTVLVTERGTFTVESTIQVFDDSVAFLKQLKQPNGGWIEHCLCVSSESMQLTSCGYLPM